VSRNYKYLWSLVPPLLVIGGNLAGGYWVAANFVFSLGLLAILERWVPENTSNQQNSTSWFPNGLLWIHVMLQTLCIVTMITYVRWFEPNGFQWLLLSLSVGVNSGASAIVIAHELIHRKNKWLNMAGQYLLITACNIYFYIDHLKVHHKYVGTPRDPATARKGEGLYAFVFRTIPGQIRSAWSVEARRLKESGRWSLDPRNYVVGALIVVVLISILIYTLFGLPAAAAWLMQGVIANFLLEYTNYIEHYGLYRKDNERVREIHSWQTDKVISRYFLIDLSRHADHHYYASKPYHTLDSFPSSPVLPGGYVSMIYYALVPRLFFRKMDPLVDKAMNKQANSSENRRD
jgi:alkane 1-monooxygenase